MTCQSPTTPSGPVGYGLTFVHPTVARRFLASFDVTSPPDPLFALGHFEIGSMAGTIEPETLASCVTLEVQFEGQRAVEEEDFAVPVLQISAIAVRQDLPVNPLELQDHLVRAARHAAGHLGVSESTTAGPQCGSDDDCTDPAAPFCGSEGQCVSCAQTSDPDGACAGLDPQAGVCDAGVCVQCTADQAEACSGQAPVCDPSSNACVGCTEHDQCPESACHLDGVNAGACFDASEVQMIANGPELEAALGAIGDGRAVLVLADGTYNVTLQVGGTAEIAILGSGAPILAGAGIRVVDSFGDSLLYFDGVQIVNASGLGVACAGAAVWVDDGAVRNSTGLGMDVSGDCDVHLRRSLVLGNDDGGIDMTGGQLSVRNSVISFNGDEFTSFLGGLEVTGTAVDITYSTLIGNRAMNTELGSVHCNGGESGEIRNSIIAASGNSVDGCDGLSFLGNAVDDPDAAENGTEVGPAMPAWFVDLGMSDFHLSRAGAAVLMGIAMWQRGDPLTDIDGETIPTEIPSVPGYDQPR